MRVGGEPMFRWGGDSLSEVFEVLVIEADVLGVISDKGASLADVGEGRSVGGRRDRRSEIG